MHLESTSDHMSKARLPRQRLKTLADLDQRTTAPKLATSRKAAISADLGGDLSTMQQEIVTRAVLSGAMLEHVEAQWLDGVQIDYVAYASLVNVQRRLLATLGLQRRARDVTSLGQILRNGHEVRP